MPIRGNNKSAELPNRPCAVHSGPPETRPSIPPAEAPLSTNIHGTTQRPIPPAFLKRFYEGAISEQKEWLVPPEVVRYYMNDFHKGDHDLNPSDYEHPEEFKRQLELIEAKQLIVVGDRPDVSPDMQWYFAGNLGHGSFGKVYLWEWHPFGNMVYPVSAFISFLDHI